jgi:predicted ester cyclase
VSDVEESALRLTGQIYVAALDKQQWSGLVESIARSVDGQGGMLRLTDYTHQQVGFFETFPDQ